MNKMPARGAAVLGATIVAAALSVTGSAHATPDSPPPASAAVLPADLVAAVERDLGMTPQEYLQRAAAAQQVGGFVAERRRSDPSGYAGAWLAADGTPTVAVTRTELATDVTDAGFRAQVTPFGASFREDGQVRPMPPNVRFEAASTVVSGAGPTGGDGYITTSVPIAQAPSYLVCSFGFTASDAAGRPLALSAGHCDPSPGTTGTDAAAQVYEPESSDLRASRRVGSFETSGIGDTGGGLDYAVIALTEESGTGPLGQPSVRGAGGSVLSLTGAGAPVAGAPVCKSGQTSGYTCGTVLSADYSTNMAGSGAEMWTVRGFTHSACTLGGDSGGAIVSGTVAVGITSGSSTASAPSCDVVPSDEAMGLGMRIGDVLSRLNGPASSCATGPRIAVRTVTDPVATSLVSACGGEDSDPADGGGPGGFGSLGSLG